MARRKGPPSRLKIPRAIKRHRRTSSDGSVTESILSAELEGEFPRTPDTPDTPDTPGTPGTPPPPPPMPPPPMLAAVMGLEGGLTGHLKGDDGKMNGRRGMALLKDVSKDLGGSGGVVVTQETQEEEEGTVEREEVKEEGEEVKEESEQVKEESEEVKEELEEVKEEREKVKEERQKVKEEEEKVKEEEEKVKEEGEKVKGEMEKFKRERERKVVPGKLRYFEGIPLREGEKGKGLTGWSGWERWERREKREKRVRVVIPEGVRETCLQCGVRNLRCTLTKKLIVPGGDGVWRAGPCWRCVQHGDRHECLVKPGPAGWQFAEKDFTVLPYDPTADFYAKVTKEQEVVLVNFKDEGRTREILDKWIEREEKVVVDTIANFTAKVKISAFAPPRPPNAKELEPFIYKDDDGGVILRR